MDDMNDYDWQLIRQLLAMLRRAGETPSSLGGGQPVPRPSLALHSTGCSGCAASSHPAASALPFRQTERQAKTTARLEPGVVRTMIQEREKRRTMFGAELVADPVWDMLLDLTAAYLEGRQVSVTSLCLASGVPQSTALRWIGRMTREGMVERIDDRLDRRRAYVRLSRKTLQDMLRFLTPEQADETVIPLPFGKPPAAIGAGVLRQING